MASSARALPRGSRLPPPLNQLSGMQWLILAVVLAGMAAVGNEAFKRTVGTGESAQTAVQTGAVGRRTIESTISATGTVNPIRQVRVTFPTAGQVSEVLVKQGDRVVEGQPLATLNTFSLEVKRDQARTNLATAQYRLDALLQGPTNADVSAAQQAVASSQAALTRAQNDLFNLLAGATADEIAAARTSLDRAQASLNAAQTNWDRLASGADRMLRPEYQALQTARANQQQALANFVNRSGPPNSLDVSNAQATLSSAQATLDSARTRLTQVLAGPDPLDVANARNLVTSAEAGLTAAQAKLDALLTPAATTTAVEIAALEAAVEAARANLNAALSAQTEALFSAAMGSSAEAKAAADARVASARASLAAAQSSLARATAATTPNSTEVLAAQQTVATAQTTLLNAQNTLQKLLAGPSAADIAAAQQAVSAAEGQVQTARNNLDKLLLGATPEEIAAARAALDNANAALEVAQANWDRLESGADLETRPEYTALMAARADYQTALTAYNARTQGPKPGDVAAAQSAVDSASALLNSSLARLEQVMGGSLPTDIGIAREAVNNAELALRQAQRDLDGATITSPIKGTVVSVGVNPGDQVTSATNAFAVLDPELIRVDATVDESNVVRLKQGMPVTVSFDALQGRSFQGIVASVTPAGVTQQGVVTFPVTVVFNSQGFTIPPGTTATLRVVAESKPNVIAVPSRAIQRQGRTQSVMVMENGKPVPRTVRTGISGDNFTEILEGLNEGDVIVISAPQQTGAQGTFGSGGLPGLGTGAPAPGQPVRR